MSEIRDEDIEVIAMNQLRERRGGQHAGGPVPGVIAIHRPTGIAAACEDERSQIKNKAAAIAKLRGVLGLEAEIKRLQRVILETSGAFEPQDVDRILEDP